ncbi:MAG: NAD(P)/FAD-dependent oxidoreductase [Archangium sp.]
MNSPSSEAVVIVGAGVSGLSCAQALRSAGRDVVVLERARGVGGRCATRRLEEHAFDFGPTFLHGSDSEFIDALMQVPAARVEGWPAVVAGQGQPCQPAAFTPGERRVAFEEGVVAFPRHLAANLDVRLQQRVVRVEAAGSTLLLETDDGREYQSTVVVFAMAAEQTRSLLQTMKTVSPEVRAASAVLGLSHSQATLALLALYPDDVPFVSWQMCFPKQSKLLQLVSNESSKRPSRSKKALVLQARPAWSRENLENPAWPEVLLAEAGLLMGPWAAKPAASSAHRWTWGRNGRDAELAGPMLLSLQNGARLGVCGDRFAPGAGVEAAFSSGRALAARILAEPKEER